MKNKMKNGLRRQFRKILNHPDVNYFGNVVLGKQADISLEELQEMGFTAVLFTVGAQKTRQLGLPGEGLDSVYHAKELVSHFNQLPPYSTQSYPLGERVAIVGVGNVMVDITNLAIHTAKVKEITAVARRSAADVKFSKKGLKPIHYRILRRKANMPPKAMGIANIKKLADMSIPAAIMYPATAGPATAPERPRPMAQPTPVLRISVG